MRPPRSPTLSLSGSPPPLPPRGGPPPTFPTATFLTALAPLSRALPHRSAQLATVLASFRLSAATTTSPLLLVGGPATGKACALSAVAGCAAMARTRLVSVDAVPAGTPAALYGAVLSGMAWRDPSPVGEGFLGGGGFVRAVGALLGRPELGAVPPGVEAGVFGGGVGGGRGVGCAPPSTRTGSGGGAGGGTPRLLPSCLPPPPLPTGATSPPCAERLRRGGQHPPRVLATLSRLRATVNGHRPLTVVFLSDVG